MRHNQYAIVILLSLIIVNVACVAQAKAIIVPFEISGASYFSWVASENERGTTVEIKLENVAPQVQVDSVVFRKVMLPVRISKHNEKGLTLTAILPSGETRLPVETKHVDQPDQLIFNYNGKREVQLLKQIVRKKMVYYHK